MAVKAFELVAVLEKLGVGTDRSEQSKSEIECIGIDGKHLYVGTADGTVLHYTVGRRTVEGVDSRGSSKPEGRSLFDCHLCASKCINASRKPVEQLLPVSLTRHLLVLSDSTLVVLDATRLESVLTPVRSVVHVSANVSKNVSNPFSTEFCVALKRKALQLYNLTEEQLILTREIHLPESALLVTLTASIACVALQTRYVFADCRSGKVTTLFPFSGEDGSEMHPIVKAVDEDDFLLGGPGGLGMFITASGIAGRPPLSWGEGVHDVACRYPYAVVMSDRSLAVHSILDQQSKQVFQFQTGRRLAEAGDCIMVASAKALFALVPVPFSKQIRTLLAERRVEDALTLARSVFSASAKRDAADGSSEQDAETEELRLVEQQAAFVEFALGRLDEARALFISSGVDAREIISLFPGLPPEGATYPRSASTVSQLVDVEQACKGDATRLEHYKTFLLSYVESGCYSPDAKKDAHTALLKLYAERRSAQLCDFAEDAFDGHFDECARCLTARGCHHTAAILRLRSNEPEKALDIWASLAEGRLVDADFGQGISYIAKVLTRLKEPGLVMKHCDLVLRRDQGLGATIFTKREESSAAGKSADLNPEAVIERLAPYRESLISYIEHLVGNRRLENEAYATHLIMLYLDNILAILNSAQKTKGDAAQTKSKLQALLQSRAAYRAQLVLARVQASEQLSALLEEERACLHGRLGQHEQALRILALHRLGGGGGAGSQTAAAASALRYCVLHSGSASVGVKSADAKGLFYILLSIYIDEASRDPRFVVPAVDLLNSPEASFDAVKVLQLLPNNWSVALLTPFLLNSTLRSLSDGRTAKVQRALAKCESDRVGLQFRQLHNQRVVVTEDRTCDFCKRTFAEPSFVFLPGGNVCHSGNCAKNLAGGGNASLP